MDDVIRLISQQKTKNKYGVDVTTNTAKEVFCQVHSITRQEFFDAGRNGLNPQFMFTIFHGDYDGECEVEYAGKTYAVYRAYTVPGNDYIELYVERKGGTNGESYAEQSGQGDTQDP